MEYHDFFKNYRVTKNKIKKRFIRKPKICDAIHEFQTLAKKLNENNTHDYSAVIYLANARCENLYGNQVNEVQTLLESGQQYLKELITQADKGHILNRDELLASSNNLYSHAIRISFQKQNYSYAGLICIQLALSLKYLGKEKEACFYYLRALEYIIDIPSLFVFILQQLIYSLIDQGEYENSLMLCNDVFTFIDEYNIGDSIIEDSYQYIFKDIYITQLLLLMIIRPTFVSLRSAPYIDNILSSQHKKGQYLKASLNEDFDKTIRSFLVSWIEQDLEALEISQQILVPFLTNKQEVLLRRVVENSFD